MLGEGCGMMDDGWWVMGDGWWDVGMLDVWCGMMGDASGAATVKDE